MIEEAGTVAGLLHGLTQGWRRRYWRVDAAALAAFADLRPMTVVTGASEGIGLALAQRFAAAGHDVLLVARRPEPLSQAAGGIRAGFKVDAVAVPVDITSPQAIACIEAELARQHAYADVLINNAGIGLAGPVHQNSPEAVMGLIDLNVRALTALTRHFLPGMRTRGRGGILNVASLGGYAPGPYQAVYYASKAFVLSLTEALAAETAGEGVRICALAPGPVATAFHLRMGAGSSFYVRLLPAASAAAVARVGYRGFALGWRVTVAGVLDPFMLLAMRVLPHRLLLPFIAFLLKPRGCKSSDV
jgi:uncharacterized protein